MEGDAYGRAMVLDSMGTVQAPNRPYEVLDAEMSKLQRANVWPSLQAMLASIKQNAPDPRGLPPGAPNPNAVYQKDGKYVRYVIDSSEPREHFVEGGVVRERLAFTPRLVSLSLDGARKASASANATKADYWNGFTWIRNGHIPERDFPVMAKTAQDSVDGERLTFSQPVSATDEARIRHEVSAMDRARPTLPVETAGTIAVEPTQAASVPFPEAADVAYPDVELPTDDFIPPPGDAEKRAPGRPRKES